MEKTYDINVLSNGILEIRETTLQVDNNVTTDKSLHRYCLSPGADLTDQPQEVVDKAAEVWSEEVIQAFEESRTEMMRQAFSAR
jgi:hypothetical protein